MRKRVESKDETIDRAIAKLSRLTEDQEDRKRIASLIQALDAKYDLARKIAGEPGVADIVEQMLGRLLNAFGKLSNVRGQRILDIACGSNTSRAPSSFTINTPFGEKRIGRLPKGRVNTQTRRSLCIHPSGYTAQFEPWFCRMLFELGANPVGVDFGDLEGEAFEHYRVDLGQSGALDFLPSHSFDAVQDSRLFGSPEFTAQFPKRADRLQVAREITQQEKRLLKPSGTVVHSDAKDWL